MNILDKRIEFSTPWFELISKHVEGEKAPFYSLRMSDYVCIIAFTPADELILVRQFRPAVERSTIELPSGHVEKGESAEQSARRELLEECGYDAANLDLLGTLLSDTGRNENRLWCFFAHSAVPVANFVPEKGVERLLVPGHQIRKLIFAGDFDFSMHLAALLLGALKYRDSPLSALFAVAGGSK